MNKQDPRDQPVMWRFQDNLPGDRVTFEYFTENGHYQFQCIKRYAWNALVRDMTEADERGESVEPVLQRWALAIDAERDAVHEMRMAQLEVEENEDD